jgi:Zn finger protein HypA/HybF involved in hydrogenase expression
MGGKRKMQKISDSLTFRCPGCKETFEFDPVDEYQLVPCPICGIELMTIRKNQALQLEPFVFNEENPDNKVKAACPQKLGVEVKPLKVKCVGCEKKFDVYPENFSNFEVIFCPVCGLDHQVVKNTNRVTVKTIQFA